MTHTTKLLICIALCGVIYLCTPSARACEAPGPCYSLNASTGLWEAYGCAETPCTDSCDYCSESSCACEPVCVEPVADFDVGGFLEGEDVVALLEAELTFNGSDSYDDDGTTLLYSWSYGDTHTGGPFVSASHAYEDGGEYTAQLVVLDSDYSECDEDCPDHQSDAVSREIRILEVGLQAVASGNSPELLPHGRICKNAQACYKKAKWKATVKGGGTACVTAYYVTFEGIDGSNPLELYDGEEFWAVSGEVGGSIGDYTITITHNEVSECNASEGEVQFTFEHCLNTDTVPSVRQSSATTQTDTSAGGAHDGGYAKLTWTAHDSDGAYYLVAGIGDWLQDDCQPDIGGSAQNYPLVGGTAGTNGVEFHAAVHEKGEVEVGTWPQDVFDGTVRIELDMAIDGTLAWHGYKGFNVGVKIGGSLGVIKFGVTLDEVEINTGSISAGGIGMYWDTICVGFDKRIHHQYGFDPYMIGGTDDLEVALARVSDEGSLPLNTPVGFAGAVAVNEEIFSDLLTCRSALSGMHFTFDNEEFTILTVPTP